MTDNKLLAEFTRVSPGADGAVLECLDIIWPHPSTPESCWMPVKTLSPGLEVGEVEAARLALLHLPRFFRVCRRCGERHPVGWMLDKHTCQSCAERDLGVVF
jgi:hypothetical protein